jgi:beta-glucanase (GH16 family)
MGNGYYEARILVPQANSGGTWPSFFMQTLNSMKTKCASGDIEEDVTEEYGNDPTYTQMGQHPYCGATGADSLVYAGHPEDLASAFRRHGLLITDTTISYYLDDKLMASAPRDQLVGGVAPQWFLMITMAMGGGWPVVAPPAGHYDCYVDYLRVLAP